MKKTISVIAIFLTVFLLCAPNHSFAKPNYVSLRNVFESMGSTVEKVGTGIEINRNGSKVMVFPNSRVAYKNGKKLRLYKPIQFLPNKGQHVIHVLDIRKLAKMDNQERHYRVKKGDSLFKIAARFGVSVTELKRWNNLRNPTISENQHLHTRNPYYTVKEGDNLWEIAEQNEVTVNAIKNANHLVTDFLKPGQSIYIPIQPSLKEPKMFANGIFPLVDGTYEPYGNDYGNTRSFSTDGSARAHEGIDILAPSWVPIFSITEGEIINIGWNVYGGWRLTIKAPNGVAFYYAHMNGYPEGLKMGQTVSRGQLIGYVGDTGYGEKGTNGKFIPHLHLSMYDTNLSPWKPLNPFYYLKWWEAAN